MHSHAAQAALRQLPRASQVTHLSALHFAAQQRQRSYVAVPKSSDSTLTRNKHQSIITEEFQLELGGSLPEVAIEWEQWAIPRYLETALFYCFLLLKLQPRRVQP